MPYPREAVARTCVAILRELLERLPQCGGSWPLGLLEPIPTDTTDAPAYGHTRYSPVRRDPAGGVTVTSLT